MRTLPETPRQRTAARYVLELCADEAVNLDLGVPTLTANHLDTGTGVTFHTEDSVSDLSRCPPLEVIDNDPTDAGCESIALMLGVVFTDLATSLGATCSSYIGVMTLSVLQVDALGNLTNWVYDCNGKWRPGIGKAMNLCYGTRKVIAALAHTDRHGSSKILPHCMLSLTSRCCVRVIATEHAASDVTDAGLVLRKILSCVTLDDIRVMTVAPFTFTSLL